MAACVRHARGSNEVMHKSRTAFEPAADLPNECIAK